MNATRNLAIVLFDDAEVLGFCGPFEVFSVASRQTDPPAFSIFTVSEVQNAVPKRTTIKPQTKVRGP